MDKSNNTLNARNAHTHTHILTYTHTHTPTRSYMHTYTHTSQHNPHTHPQRRSYDPRSKHKHSPTALWSICFWRPRTVMMWVIMPAVQQLMRLRCPCAHRLVSRSASHTCSSRDWTSGSHCSSIMAAWVLTTRILLLLSYCSSTTWGRHKHSNLTCLVNSLG